MGTFALSSGDLAAFTNVRLPLAGRVHPALKKRSERLQTPLPWSLGDSVAVTAMIHVIGRQKCATVDEAKG